ncbi:MAG: hypothetical protein WCE93_08220, partial [Nitrososphaeraceae archaeon]
LNNSLIDSLVSILYLPYFCICGYLSHSNNFFKEKHKNGKERRIGKLQDAVLHHKRYPIRRSINKRV